MSYVDVAHLSYVLPDGRPLLEDVSFRVGDGACRVSYAIAVGIDAG